MIQNKINDAKYKINTKNNQIDGHYGMNKQTSKQIFEVEQNK